MKKILLVAINARYTHSCLALYCLKSFAGGLGYDIPIREFSINQEIDAIVESIVHENPHALAISVYIWNAEKVKRILPVLKEKGLGMRIILGGPEVSYNPESWFASYPNIDFIVSGHGEQGFRHILEHHLALSEKIIRVQNPHFKDMPFPYTGEDLESLKTKYLYYESSRGCPFKCSYCLSSRGDQKLEMKGLDTVKGELESILAYKPRLLKFVDRTFNASKEHFRPIWDFLLKHYASGQTIFHYEIHPLYLDDEDIITLSSCPENVFQLEIGIQSINPATRAAIGRIGDWGMEKPVIGKLITRTRIPIHLDLIAGLPFEDINSMKCGINEIFSLNPAHAQIGFLKVLPGTDMMLQAAEHGIIYSDIAPYQVIENRWMSKGEIRLLEKIAFIVDRLYNTRRFVLTLSCLAGHVESSFDMYRELALHYDAHGNSLTRGWETGAAFLIDFILSRFPGEKAFFLDTLRWDWCVSSTARHYPEKIKPRDAGGLKKAGYRFFREIAKDTIVQFGDTVFSLSDLKRSIFFKAESDAFRRKFMDNYRCAVFLPERKNFVLYDSH